MDVKYVSQALNMEQAAYIQHVCAAPKLSKLHLNTFTLI